MTLTADLAKGSQDHIFRQGSELASRYHTGRLGLPSGTGRADLNRDPEVPGFQVWNSKLDLTGYLCDLGSKGAPCAPRNALAQFSGATETER